MADHQDAITAQLDREPTGAAVPRESAGAPAPRESAGALASQGPAGAPVPPRAGRAPAPAGAQSWSGPVGDPERTAVDQRPGHPGADAQPVVAARGLGLRTRRGWVFQDVDLDVRRG